MESKKYRHELKFICTERGLNVIESKIRHICSLDSHVGDSGSYCIRSLYFDTYDDNCYFENKIGADARSKFRLRIYDANTDFINLECKQSLHGMKTKDSCAITREQARALIAGKNVSDVTEQQELLQKFVIKRKLELLSPKIIVEYVRTPYVYKVGNVRVTFDRNISSSSAVSDFLNSTIVKRGIMPQYQHVLEVKYDEMIPAAILELVAGGLQLRRSSFSKYMLCRQYSIR